MPQERTPPEPVPDLSKRKMEKRRRIFRATGAETPTDVCPNRHLIRAIPDRNT